MTTAVSNYANGTGERCIHGFQPSWERVLCVAAPACTSGATGAPVGLSVSPPERTVSTARKCPATKNSHVRVCGPRVHTRNKTVSGTQVSSVVTQCRHDRHELRTRVCVCSAATFSQTSHLRPDRPSLGATARQTLCTEWLRRAQRLSS